MEGSSGNSYNLSGNLGRKPSELEILQKQQEAKTRKIQELKSQIESVKLNLGKKRNEVPEEKKETFKNLSAEYNKLREEYNALLATKTKE